MGKLVDGCMAGWRSESGTLTVQTSGGHVHHWTATKGCRVEGQGASTF